MSDVSFKDDLSACVFEAEIGDSGFLKVKIFFVRYHCIAVNRVCETVTIVPF